MVLRKEKNFDYFKAFVNMSDQATKAAEKLVDILDNFDPKNIQQDLTEMHDIEHNADILHHEIVRRLTKEFITPIEREDISFLAREMDEVVDCIEDVVQRIYMYNIITIPYEAKEMAKVIGKCCSSMVDALNKFSNYKKEPSIKNDLIEINRLEEDGDRLYMQGNRRLFIENKNPIEVCAWSATYIRLEKCCDACEHVADVIESIIMKNS